MKYLGGKSRIAQQIVDIMSAERESDMPWIEPFVGSAKVMSKVKGRRIAADANHEMIALFKAIRGGWKPPTEVSEEFYNEVKHNQGKYSDHLKAFIGIGCAFGGVRFSTYARDPTGRSNFALQAHNSLMRIKLSLQDIEFYATDYRLLQIPTRSLIYCDPPYAGTPGYGFDFNHSEFYQWCRDKVNEGHYLFVSEYSMPADFQEVWSRDVHVTVRNYDIKKTNTERLYRLHKKPPFSLKMY